MRIGVVAPYLDSTGYAASGSLYARALHAAGADVVCRAVGHNGRRCRPHPLVHELMGRDGGPVDVLVQHSLPPFFSRFEGPLNVGLFYPETAPLPATWAGGCRLMDVNLTACREHATVLGRAGLRSQSVPVPFDTGVLGKTYPKPPELAPFAPFFTFYAVGEAVARKNWAGLFRAFLGEFRDDEPVRLFVKTDRADELAALARQIRREQGKPDGGGTVAVCGRRFSEAELFGLHQHADCHVTASHAEGWGLPTFDALAFGKTPVAPAHSAFLDYLDADTSYPVPAQQAPARGDPTDLYGPAQLWWEPDPLALRAALRQAYSDAEGRARRARLGPDSAARFDLPSVGRLLLEALNGPQDQVRPGPVAGGA